MQSLTSKIELARREAARHPKRKAGYFLCKNNRSSEIAAGLGVPTPESFSWDIYESAQQGFKTASERIPLVGEAAELTL